MATGSELLSGRSVNTHAQRLARGLDALGLALARETTVPDDVAALREAVGEALARAQVVFVSGGLGPTCDDLTREALGGLLGRPVVTDPATLEALRARYARMGREFTAARRRQAEVIAGAEVLHNPAGAAPGQCIETAGALLVVLPGPPVEFEALLAAEVLPRLRARYGAGAAPEHVFLVCGPGEADIVERLAAAGFKPSGVRLAYGASPGRIEVRLRGDGADPAGLAEAAGRLRALLGADCYAERNMGIEERVGALLREQGRTLAVAESCTGGLVGYRVTAVAGSSAYFLGGVIAYGNEVKVSHLGVPADRIGREGAVSAAVAVAMASGVRRRFGADYGLAVTGVAGPGGGTEHKPVGRVYVGLAGPDGVGHRRFQFAFGREMNRIVTAQVALDTLRRRLEGRPEG